MDGLWASGERTKHQIPESKHQKPSSKQQINPKFQAPNRGPRFELGTWSLELPWSLVFGALSDCAFTQSRYTARVFHLTFPGLTRRSRLATALLAGLTGLSGVAAIAQPTLPGTQELTWQDDLSTRMVQGIDKFLMREIDRSVEERKKLWHRDFSSTDAYQKSVQTNRRDFQRCIGAVDARR